MARGAIKRSFGAASDQLLTTNLVRTEHLQGPVGGVLQQQTRGGRSSKAGNTPELNNKRWVKDSFLPVGQAVHVYS